MLEVQRRWRGGGSATVEWNGGFWIIDSTNLGHTAYDRYYPVIIDSDAHIPPGVPIDYEQPWYEIEAGALDGRFYLDTSHTTYDKTSLGMIFNVPKAISSLVGIPAMVYIELHARVSPGAVKISESPAYQVNVDFGQMLEQAVSKLARVYITDDRKFMVVRWMVQGLIRSYDLPAFQVVLTTWFESNGAAHKINYHYGVDIDIGYTYPSKPLPPPEPVLNLSSRQPRSIDQWELVSALEESDN